MKNLFAHKKRYKPFPYQLLIIGIVFFSLLSILFPKNSPKKSKVIMLTMPYKSVHAQSMLTKVIASPTPKQTPTSSPLVTPTIFQTTLASIVPVGYCLTIPVLYYHHVQSLAIAKAHGNINLTVDNAIFAEQMQYLVDHGYTTITAEQLMKALADHTTLPEKSVVITLDDGYKDNYIYAYPIFQKYHLQATIMLATGLLEGSDYLTWSQVEEMQKSGLINYTDHTWSHYAVNHGTDTKIQYEIMTAKQQIASHIGIEMNIFTYPYGSFNSHVISLLQQDGFIGAFSTLPGKLQCDSYIMALHRTRIGNAQLSLYGF